MSCVFVRLVVLIGFRCPWQIFPPPHPRLDMWLCNRCLHAHLNASLPLSNKCYPVACLSPQAEMWLRTKKLADISKEEMVQLKVRIAV